MRVLNTLAITLDESPAKAADDRAVSILDRHSPKVNAGTPIVTRALSELLQSTLFCHVRREQRRGREASSQDGHDLYRIGGISIVQVGCWRAKTGRGRA